MKTYCVYCHINKINGKRYVGQTSQQVKKRWNYGYGYKNCPYFYRAIQKYGWNNFQHIILEESLSLEQAEIKEKYYIKLFQTTDVKKGYNLTCGGNSLANYYKEDKNRKKQSQLRKQYFINNPQEKQKNANFLSQLARKTAQQRSIKMKNNYMNQQGLYKINQQRKKRVKCIETKKDFNSLTQAGKFYNIPAGNISKVVHGERKTAGGYHWQLI